MKWNLHIIAGAAAASLLAFPALARETLNPKPDETASPHQRLTQARAERLNGAARATDIIGMTVENYQNEKLGNVEDLALDVESGRIVQVILFTGGLPGRSNAFTAVPPGALRYEAADQVLQLNASKAKLAAALKFDTSKWDEATQSNRAAEVYDYYGAQSYFVADNDGYRNDSLEGTVASTRPRRMDGSINTDGARTLDKASNVAAARYLETTNNWISTRNPDGTWTREYYSTERRANNAWSRLGYVQKAGKLLGAPVKNLQGQELGRVENFMVDLSAGRIVAVIVSSGFPDPGGELSAVPPTALQFNPAHDILQLDASREMLANAPRFKANQWPDFSQPGYAGGVYRAYNVEPYFSPAAATGADNPRPDVRDREGRTLATVDQGNRPADMDTEAQIRLEIVAERNMSLNGRNVKITAIDGRVILCGPVDSAEEKRLIGEIADRIARARNVDNQLEVQFTVSRSN